jgi:hypothetical protein
MKPYPSFRDMERLSGITWQYLVEREPRLAELLWAARQACVTCRRWSDVDRAFAPVRVALAGLVGYAGKHHAHPVLGSARAHTVAYWKLYDAVAGLLPGRAAGPDRAPAKPRGETVAAARPPESAAARDEAGFVAGRGI